jgi:hypothetical protein
MRSVAVGAALAATIAGPAVMPADAEAAPECPVGPSPGDEASIATMINGTPQVARPREGPTRGRHQARRATVEHADGEHRRLRAQQAAVGPRPAGRREHRHGHDRAGRLPGAARQPASPREPAGAGLALHRGVAVRCDGMLFVTVNLMGPPRLG